MVRSRNPASSPAEQPAEPPSADEAPPVEQKTGKTLQELERIQFDALDRAGFDRR